MTRKAGAQPKAPAARTIGRLAAETGVSVETIRFYQRRGLLGCPARGLGGWREYSDEARWTVHYIRSGQQLGFTLREIKALGSALGTGAHFCESFQQAMKDKLLSLDQQIAQLTTTRASLAQVLSQCGQKARTGECPISQRCEPVRTKSTSQVASSR